MRAALGRIRPAGRVVRRERSGDTRKWDSSLSVRNEKELGRCRNMDQAKLCNPRHLHCKQPAVLDPVIMLVLAMLHTAQYARLELALGTTYRIERHDPGSPEIASKCACADVIVADPLVLTDSEGLQPTWIGELRDKMVLYSHPTPEAMRATITLVNRGVANVLLAGYDDSGPGLRRIIEAARARSLAHRAVQLLTPELARLPLALAEVLRKALFQPVTHASVDAVCREAGTARRSCNRWIRQAGLHSLHRFLRAARALHIVSYLRGDKFTLPDVAARVGLGSGHQVTTLCREVFGVSASKLRALPDVAVLERYGRYVCEVRLALA